MTEQQAVEGIEWATREITALRAKVASLEAAQSARNEPKIASPPTGDVVEARVAFKLAASLAAEPVCGQDIAPTGWWCSRTKGHEGPCAAHEKAEANPLIIAEGALRTARFAILRQCDTFKAETEITTALWHIRHALAADPADPKVSSDVVERAELAWVEYNHDPRSANRLPSHNLQTSFIAGYTAALTAIPIPAPTGEVERLLRMWRDLVIEGGVPRYTVLPGAALNTLVGWTDAALTDHTTKDDE